MRRRRGLLVLLVWAGGFAWLGCNALLGNESAVFEPDGGTGTGAETGATEGGSNEDGASETGSTDGALDGPRDAAPDVVHPCTTTTADTFNCGACGHDCLGGACTSGKCQPVILATELGEPSAIAVDATHVYWTNRATGGVHRVPIAGGAIEVVFDGPSGTTLGDGLVRSGSDVYFTNSDFDGGVFRCPASGCGVAGPQAVLFPLLAPQFVGLADGGVLLVSEQAVPGRVGRCTLPCTSGLEVVAPSEGLPWFVSAEGDAFYWATLIPNGGNLRGQADLASAPVDLVAGHTVRQVEVHGSEVLFAERGAGVKAVGRDGGATRKILDTSTDTERFAIDGNQVYFGDQIALGSIFHCAVSGCGDAGATLATGQDHPHAVAFDQTSVYWTNSGSGANGSVVRVAK